MKLKAVRLSLAAVLTATLLISLLPLAYANSTTSQTQQDASSSKPRRGKNGEPVTTFEVKLEYQGVFETWTKRNVG